MISISSYEIAKEQQRDTREGADEERSARPHVDKGADVTRSGVRHLVASTLRRVADSLEPAI
ncbi:MAG TPA: hypothetical protein VFX77_00810 [Rubrobacter sp.]|nr:hypothetical protein [Rubrobacter sp.]